MSSLRLPHHRSRNGIERQLLLLRTLCAPQRRAGFGGSKRLTVADGRQSPIAEWSWAQARLRRAFFKTKRGRSVRRIVPGTFRFAAASFAYVEFGRTTLR